ncbi:hypothetical protein BTO05_02835 [Winogradskyella sp. PC-19]|uniref:DMP19 family protein n=1 Tax=unclassified Winogradskyella TaxID=2615021 RepID=UPI000B3C5C70|nr:MULTISPECIES: DUF4375 domain-containing protein [unclassified Winogradskyella]ARV08625.1 hypothetical protein BTO05_02835 [Winogradskyella sp. PC-19]RZN81473.1 MAG: DUF4375 domain-containing protein [Winogradskyella sp.]
MITKMTEIDFALSQNSDTDKIELVGTVLWNKSHEAGHFTKLSEAEQTFVFIDIFESEINRNGLFGFFYNTSGEYAHEVLQAFQNVKAENSAAIINDAIRVFKALPISKDILQRRQQISKLKQEELEVWSELEFQLIESKEDIITLLINYIALHKTDFEY